MAVDILTKITSKTQTEVSKKTYADKSDIFQDVFDKINKNYKDDDKKVNYDKKKIEYEKSAEENSKDTTEKIKDSEVKKSDSSNEKVEEKPEKSKEESKKQDSEENNQAQNKTEEKEVKNETKQEKSENNSQAQPVQENQSTKNNLPLQIGIENIAKPDVAGIILNNIQTNTNNNTTPVEVVKIQPQTQQVLINLNVENINPQSLPSAENIEPSVKNVKPDLQSLETEIKAKTPLIQANVEIKTKEAENPEQKQAIKDVLQKAVLTQEMLDATNARVVSVETNLPSDNLLNKQSAQEQGLKSLMETNQQNNQNLNIASTKTSFDKTVDITQNAKEISKSDILTQIHTKLTEAKEEGSTKITIILKPESLGKVNLELINGKDGLIARMTAENVQVKELLEKNLDTLKSSLSTQGVNVNEVNIKVENIEKQSNEMLNFEYQQKNMQNEEESQEDLKNAQNKEQENQNELSDDDEFSDENIEKTQTLTEHTGRVDYKV